MPNTFRPRGAPTAEPNPYVDSYNDWDLVHRGSMIPWGVYEKDGKTSAGFAWPGMITEPLEAGNRLFKPGGTFEQNPTPESSQDMLTELMSIYGGNSMNPAAAMPKNALGMFAGRKAATADHVALARAEQLAASGADRNAIWNETGWFQGPDQKWRFEIDDSGAKFNVGGDYPWSVGNAMDHPDLMAAYPDMASIKIGRTSPTGGGAYLEDIDRISLGLYPHQKDASTLLHETQHALQSREGFTRGNNSKDAPADIQSSGLGHEWYRRHAGETEARNVQTRMNMTPEQRRATPPWETQDVPYEDQIVRLLSDTGKPSLLGAALASLQDKLGLTRGAVAENALASGAKHLGSALASELPMDQASRLARAREMGFDTDNVLYHGTPHKFQSFDPGPHRVGTGGGDVNHPMSEHGVFLTPDRAIASLYGPNVHEVYIRPGNQAKYYDDIADPQAINRQAENLSNAKNNGFNSVVLNDNNPRVTPETVVFDPSRIRHTTAAFDPAYIDSKGLFLSDTGRPSLMGSALASEQGKGITAYHGSPHDFDKFDMSKIGSGEGAQAYGHGLYFAENEGVAKWYKDVLPAKQTWKQHGRWKEPVASVTVDGSTPSPSTFSSWWLEDGADDMAHYPTFESFESDKLKLAKESPYRETRDGITEAVKELRTLYDSGRLKWDAKDKGHMYQVRINANPEDFLDWDKPLSQQSEKVRNVVIDHQKKLAQKTGMRLNDSRIQDFEAFFPISRGEGLDPENALREAGIPGIRYLDQMSRAAGDGSSNYVVFDDSLIDIIKKYGLAGLSLYGANSLLPSSSGGETY